jgi:hypothetical protein
MPRKSAKQEKSPLKKLTDSERHKAFKEVARQIGASDDPKDFERALKKVAPSKRLS